MDIYLHKLDAPSLSHFSFSHHFLSFSHHIWATLNMVVKDTLIHMLTRLPCQPGVLLFYVFRFSFKGRKMRRFIMKALVSPRQKPGASWSPLLVLPWYCWALILPVPWLLVLCFGPRSGVCWKGCRSSGLLSDMSCCSWIMDEWRDSILDVYCPVLFAFHTFHSCLTFCCILLLFLKVFMESLYIS